MAAAELNVRQKRFLDDYFQEREQQPLHVLYQRQYPKAKVDRQAQRRASAIVNSVNGQAYLAEKEQRAQTRIDHSEDKLIEAFAEQAFFDPIDILDDQGMLRELSDIPPAARRCIASITPTPGGVHKVTFVDRQNALKQLGTLLGMYRDKEGSSEKGVLEQLAELIRPQGRPGRVQMDIAVAARSQFDTDG